MKKQVILIIDDNRFARNILSNISLSLGFDVIVAADGQEALEILQHRKHAVDIVITDHNMPIVKGLQFAISFKMIKKYEKVPIILYTQESNIDYKENINYDIFDYIFNKSASLKEIVYKAKELNDLKGLRKDAIKLHNDIIKELKIVLLDLGANLLSISGRIKTIPSIYSKLNNNTHVIDNIKDILGFRIIVKTIKNCYKALKLLKKEYNCLDNRIKDYIKHPKDNGYQSIHMVITGPFKKNMEIQIRTSEMHNIAENGSASHSIYKDNIQNKEK
ncbi:response regulator [Rickettsiales endosymbiont of Trichoplax sp. H2]|uniref:response regulator n=1 Tax=Rickettsiales endosymbiont of Trichoplax sp. H2 TaxID=2021221 RepID=UPI0012B1C731|nr:response regulator [Rickettsiales endosymbiont of Trichoplax sp. H2]MSO13721.1 GTP pyrophosphokinase rsh [Rickettsiales endosymbiont of Trichoplax sp. H2]